MNFTSHHNSFASGRKRAVWALVLLLVTLLSATAPNLALAVDDCGQDQLELYEEAPTCIECEHFACACQLTAPPPMVRTQASCDLPVALAEKCSDGPTNLYLDPPPKPLSKPPRA